MTEKLEELIKEFKEILNTDTKYIRLKNAELRSIATTINYQIEQEKDNDSYDLSSEEEEEIEAIKRYMLL